MHGQQNIKFSRNFHDIGYLVFENVRKFMFHYNLTRIMGTLHEDQYTFLIPSH